MSVLLALRLGRWGIVGFSAFAFVATLVQALGFYAIAGNSPAERAAFGRSMSVLAAQFTVILPPPIRPDTVGGYVQWRGFNVVAVLFAIWALASATGAARGDEERGVSEGVLAAGISRFGLTASRLIAFAIAISIATIAAAAGYVVGVRSGHEVFDGRALLEVALLLAGLGLSCYAICLLVCQLTAARIATAAAGTLLLILFLDNSLSHTFSSLASWRWLSPFRYYELSQPLPPGGAFDARALLALLGICVGAGAAAAIAFTWRDLGSPLVRLPARSHATTYDATRALWWRIHVIRGLYDRRIALVAWSAGFAFLAFIFVSLTRTIVDPLLSIRALAPYFEAFVHGSVYPAFLGFTWFNIAQLLFAAFSISQVARWSAEDMDGRLEIILSQPISRFGVVLERMAVLTLGALLIAAISGVAVFYASRSQGIELNGPRLAAASLMLVPFALVFAAFGSLLAAWSPRAAVGLLGAIAFASYLDTELAAVFKLPSWVQDLSAFKLYGRPLLNGVDGRSLTIMLLVVVAGVGSSILALQRRDVGS